MGSGFTRNSGKIKGYVGEIKGPYSGKIKGYVGEIKGLTTINIASDAHPDGVGEVHLPKIWIQTNRNSHTRACVGLAYVRPNNN